MGSHGQALGGARECKAGASGQNTRPDPLNPCPIAQNADTCAVTEPVAILTGIEKSYQMDEVEVPVLKGIDLAVQRGEVIAIIGKSGSGKSTLLRCINGLEDFQDGSLRVSGQALRHGDAAALRALRQQVGMIFQSFNLFPHLSVGRNVMLAPTLVKQRSVMRWPRPGQP